MSHFDVFNGDADGICALQQLRLDRPCASVAVTGVKRDIALLRRVDAAPGDTVTVLDVSLARNCDALQRLLAAGVSVEYFDHHFAGEVPRHPLLRAHLDPAPDVCTSVLVDRHLQGRHRAWAVVGAFGDNLPHTAQVLAQALGLAPAQCATLRTLGEAINYNAYGESEADLLVAPARLAQVLRPYASPLAFAAESPLAQALARRQQEDLALASGVGPQHVLPGASVVVLPDAAWARRVHGAFANALSRQDDARAHAVACPRPGGGWVVSVRA
ncbi:MAG TPA: acetyltransferase, partial [Ramlibacter sp.]